MVFTRRNSDHSNQKVEFKQQFHSIFHETLGFTMIVTCKNAKMVAPGVL
jgi:hypothetical protein